MAISYKPRSQYSDYLDLSETKFAFKVLKEKSGLANSGCSMAGIAPWRNFRRELSIGLGIERAKGFFFHAQGLPVPCKGNANLRAKSATLTPARLDIFSSRWPATAFNCKRAWSGCGPIPDRPWIKQSGHFLRVSWKWIDFFVEVEICQTENLA